MPRRNVLLINKWQYWRHSVPLLTLSMYNVEILLIQWTMWAPTLLECVTVMNALTEEVTISGTLCPILYRLHWCLACHCDKLTGYDEFTAHDEFLGMGWSECTSHVKHLKLTVRTNPPFLTKQDYCNQKMPLETMGDQWSWLWGWWGSIGQWGLWLLAEPGGVGSREVHWNESSRQILVYVKTRQFSHWSVCYDEFTACVTDSLFGEKGSKY